MAIHVNGDVVDVTSLYMLRVSMVLALCQVIIRSGMSSSRPSCSIALMTRFVMFPKWAHAMN